MMPHAYKRATSVDEATPQTRAGLKDVVTNHSDHRLSIGHAILKTCPLLFCYYVLSPSNQTTCYSVTMS